MKLAVVCRGSDHFLRPLFSHWRSRGWTLVEDLQEADVVWVDWANEQSARVSKLYPANKKKIIVRMHGSEFYQEFWKSWGANIAAVVCANSDMVIPRDDIERVHLFPTIDTDFWHPGDGCTEKERTLLMVGSFAYSKNHMGVLRMLTQRPHYFSRVVFIGDTNPSSSKRRVEAQKILYQLQRCAAKWGLPLHIKGQQNAESLRSFYQRAMCLVSASVNEGFHAVVAEAMSCGTHVLVQNWLGSASVYPADVIFKNEREFWAALDHYPSMHNPVESMRGVAETRFSEREQFPKIDALIERIAGV